MSKLRVLIADDEMVARKRMTRLLGSVPDVELVGECASGDEVLAALEEADADVIVLDIQMPGLSGLETKALLADDAPYVIFATAHPEHAVEAFDVGADDYILKPIEAQRLAKALERARKTLSPTALSSTDPLDRLPVSTRGGVRLVDPDSVSHAVFDGTLVTVHTGGDALLTDMSLQDLSERLDPTVFARVHRRALLNLRRVAQLEPLPTGGYVAVTDDGAKVDVSRQAARRLRKRLGLS